MTTYAWIMFKVNYFNKHSSWDVAHQKGGVTSDLMTVVMSMETLWPRCWRSDWALALLGWDGRGMGWRGKCISGVLHLQWFGSKRSMCVCSQLVYVELTNHTYYQLIASALWLLYKIALIYHQDLQLSELTLLPSIRKLMQLLSHSDIF